MLWNGFGSSKHPVGTRVERRYSLQGFGIPVEMIPITDSGNVKRTCLYRWIKVRQFLESGQYLIRTSNIHSNDSIILLPRSNDVLFRTGTTGTAHPGNAFFRGLIELKYEEVISGCEHTQAELAAEIVREIERMNGRFLKWDNRGHWTNLKERSQIIFKVEVSIRDLKSRDNAKKNLQHTACSTSSFQRQDGSRGKRRKKSNNSVDSEGINAIDKESGICGFGFTC